MVFYVSLGFLYERKSMFSFSSLDNRGRYKREEKVEEEPFITAYLHSHKKPNDLNCTDSKRITLSMTRGHDLDHRKYTFFLSPE